MKRYLKFIIPVAILIPIIGVFLIIMTGPKESSEEVKKDFTFKVTIPSNTPEQDIPYIHITDHPDQGNFKLNKVSDFVYEYSFTEEELSTTFDFPKIRYRYGRNGLGFTTMEHLADDIAKEPDMKAEEEEGNDHAYRVITYEKGKTQEDTILRWRWFPEGEIEKEDISALGPTSIFQARNGNKEFLSGVGVEDLYVPEHDPFFGTIAKRVKDKGYNFVVIYPPEQIQEIDGVPKVVNDIENAPNYPNEEKLIEHIKAFKDQGLKVFIEPQLCCDQGDFGQKSAQWWDLYIAEVQNFLIRFAKTSEKANVDALLFETYNIDQEMAGYDTKMQTMFDEVKKHYSGEFFAKIVPFLPEGVNSPQGFIPDLERMSWVDDVDFFVYDAEGELSPKSNPTEAELKEGAGKLIDLIRVVYDNYGKEVLVRTSYFAVKESWKSSPHYQSIIIPAEEHHDKRYGNEGELSTYDQARVVNAYFAAIAERPWVKGYLNFGYYHWDYPTLPHWSIRGRTGEDVWEKWMEFIFKEE